MQELGNHRNVYSLSFDCNSPRGLLVPQLADEYKGQAESEGPCKIIFEHQYDDLERILHL